MKTKLCSSFHTGDVILCTPRFPKAASDKPLCAITQGLESDKTQIAIFTLSLKQRVFFVSTLVCYFVNFAQILKLHVVIEKEM